MPKINRRQMIVTAAATAAGIAAGAVPELLRAAHVVTRPTAAAAKKPGAKPSRRPDPGYAHGAPLTATVNPVHSLHDLTPAAPPTAIALTIDDGPHPYYTPKMLDLLAEFKVPATFSMIGQQVVEQPQLVQRIADAGHQLSDHTVTHPINLPHLGPESIQREILTAHDQIAQAGGVAPKFFRSPGGNWSPQVVETATAHGMICIHWGVDPRDWARPGIGKISSDLMHAQAGDILLCHDGGGDRSETIAALRTVIPTLQKRGLTFVAL